MMLQLFSSYILGAASPSGVQMGQFLPRTAVYTISTTVIKLKLKRSAVPTATQTVQGSRPLTRSAPLPFKGRELLLVCWTRQPFIFCCVCRLALYIYTIFEPYVFFLYYSFFYYYYLLECATTPGYGRQCWASSVAPLGSATRQYTCCILFRLSPVTLPL